MLDLDLEEKYRLAKISDDAANRAAALPRTAIRRGVWPTPGMKKSGVIPSSAATANRVVNARTLPYARINIDLRIRRSFFVEGPLDQVALAVWNIDATNAPVFEIVIAALGPLGRFVSQPEKREVEPQASAPLPMRTKNVQPF